MASTDRDLVEWLRTQLDADERGLRDWVSRRCDGCGREVASRGAAGLVYCLTCRPGLLELEPVEALADVAAKRAIIDELANAMDVEECDQCDLTHDPAADQAPILLRLLASAYAHRTGYRREWRPSA